LGRDLFDSLIFGAKTTLFIAISTVMLTSLLGTAIGLLAGYFQGFIDTLIMRAVDITLAFPGFLLNLALASLLGPSVNNIIFAIAATGWASFARLVRGQVLTLKQREYITAARMLGASHSRIIFRHILPAILSVIIVTTAFSLSTVILVEASISFLGLGAPDSAPTWGSLLNQGRKVLFEAPILSIMPGLMIMLTVLSFNFIGDALRDRFDPRGG
jgi:peptide/nickel transport system permease protein